MTEPKTSEPTSGLAAEIIARNAREGTERMDFFEAEILLAERNHDVERMAQRITELEAREAKVAAFARQFDWWQQWCVVCDTEGCASPEKLWDLVPAIVEARKALDWLAVAWIEPDDMTKDASTVSIDRDRAERVQSFFEELARLGFERGVEKEIRDLVELFLIAEDTDAESWGAS